MASGSVKKSLVVYEGGVLNANSSIQLTGSNKYTVSLVYGTSGYVVVSVSGNSAILGTTPTNFTVSQSGTTLTITNNTSGNNYRYFGYGV